VVRVTGVMVKTVGVEFFCYHRDRPGSVTLRDELPEEHWSYMDRYEAEMIARGPTLGGDGDTPTGSVHIVGLPDPTAARAFAFDEPNYWDRKRLAPPVSVRPGAAGDEYILGHCRVPSSGRRAGPRRQTAAKASLARA
jgi:uncharacterized protein YciI